MGVAAHMTLLKESLKVLLERSPAGVDVDEVERQKLAVPGVTEVHDLHVWVLTSGKNALTAHVVHAEDAFGTPLIERIKETLADRFAVFHTTIQLESTPCAHSADGCNFVDKRHHEDDRSSDRVSLKRGVLR